MPDREQASQIEDVATVWAARAERGLTADERSQLDRWLEGDSRRLGAFVRAQAAWIHAERAGALGKMPEQMPDPPLETVEDEPPVYRAVSRRLLLGGGGAAAASIVAAGLFAWDRYHVLESGIGETRQIALANGTNLTLDTDTRVDIATRSDDREIVLRRGKLFLDAAQSRGLPITIGVGDLLIETAKSAFELQSLIGEPIVALVTNGGLTVSQSTGLFGKRRELPLSKGEALTLDPQERLSAANIHPAAEGSVAKLLAWRQGMLSFGGETLGDAVRAFDRYSTYRIAVADRDLANQRVSGLFKANDPKGFAMAIAASFGAIVNEQGNEIQLSLKKVPSA
jgi:transmembrane sensor